MLPTTDIYRCLSSKTGYNFGHKPQRGILAVIRLLSLHHLRNLILWSTVIRLASLSTKIPRILWRTFIHCHVHDSAPLVPNLYEMKRPIHGLLSHYFFKIISISNVHLHLCLPSVPFPSGFSIKTYVWLLFPIRSTCQTHSITINIRVFNDERPLVLKTMFTWACFSFRILFK